MHPVSQCALRDCRRELDEEVGALAPIERAAPADDERVCGDTQFAPDRAVHHPNIQHRGRRGMFLSPAMVGRMPWPNGGEHATACCADAAFRLEGPLGYHPVRLDLDGTRPQFHGRL